MVYNKPSNCLKFTQKELVHEGHIISKETYNAYGKVISRKLKQNQEAIQLQQTLDHAKTTCYNQVTTLNDKFGFNLSTQDLFNHKLSQKPNTTQAQQLWEEIQLILQENPNSVKLYKNLNDEIECIFIQTSFMREMYLKHPEIHHIDSTFKVNVENFQLYISMVKVNSNGETEIFDEEKASSKVTTNMVDKDLTNIELLKQYYPNANILLCIFHVLKWFKKLVNDTVTGKETKEQIHDILTKMVYSQSEEDFNSHYQSLKEYSEFTKLIEQIDNNWMNNQEQWVRYHRYSLYTR